MVTQTDVYLQGDPEDTVYRAMNGLVSLPLRIRRACPAIAKIFLTLRKKMRDQACFRVHTRDQMEVTS